MVGRQIEVPHTGDLMVGRFEVDRYLEWRQPEGSAIVPRCAGFTLLLARAADSDRSLTVGVNPLWRSRILHGSV